MSSTPPTADHRRYRRFYRRVSIAIDCSSFGIEIALQKCEERKSFAVNKQIPAILNFLLIKI